VFKILWLPMGGFLFILLNSTGGMKAFDAAVIAYPVCLFGQFTLIAAKYSCKSSPIERTMRRGCSARTCLRRNHGSVVV